MDSAPSSGRRTSGSGGKGRAGSRLGLKKASSPAPSRPPSSSPVPPPPPSLLAPPPVPTPAAPISSPAVPSSAPAVPTSSTAVPTSSVPLQPARVGWGAVPPMFPSEPGNQQFPNSWIYPPGGFTNFLQRPHYPQQPQLSTASKNSIIRKIEEKLFGD